MDSRNTLEAGSGEWTDADMSKMYLSADICRSDPPVAGITGKALLAFKLSHWLLDILGMTRWSLGTPGLG